VWDASDDALVAGIAAGDRDATTALVRRYQRRVFGLAVTMVRERTLAEDIAQEAFVRAWRHAGAYDPRRGSVVTWLLTITRNLAIDSLRMRRSEPLDPATLMAVAGAAPGRSPSELAEASTEADALRRALARLPNVQRRAVVLAAIGGRTGQEVSEIEGIPLGTAKTRIRMGMLRLRTCLDEPADKPAASAPGRVDDGVDEGVEAE
jgi:RNA polymerase sigma-70 factor (ECF subfamily)